MATHALSGFQTVGLVLALLLFGTAFRFAAEGPAAYLPRDFVEHPAIGTAALAAAVAWFSRPRPCVDAKGVGGMGGKRRTGFARHAHEGGRISHTFDPVERAIFVHFTDQVERNVGDDDPESRIDEHDGKVA